MYFVCVLYHYARDFCLNLVAILYYTHTHWRQTATPIELPTQLDSSAQIHIPSYRVCVGARFILFIYFVSFGCCWRSNQKTKNVKLQASSECNPSFAHNTTHNACNEVPQEYAWVWQVSQLVKWKSNTINEQNREIEMWCDAMQWKQHPALSSIERANDKSARYSR